MRATGFVLESLAAEGAGHVFLAPAGLASPLLADLAATPGLSPIVAGHACGAAMMADGYARATGRFGLALAGGEAAAIDLIPAAAAALADASPVMTVTAAAPEDGDLRRTCPDGTALAARFAALSLAAGDPGDIPRLLRACLTRLLAGPKAPVHLHLPFAAQGAEVGAGWEPLDPSLSRPRFVDSCAVERLWRGLVPEGGGGAPTRLAILAGAGVVKSGATDCLTAFAEHFNIPVATTLGGKGAFAEDHRLSLGVFGRAGHRHAVAALTSGQAEALIVLGSGLSGRDAPWGQAGGPACRVLAQVDVDPAAIGRTFPAEVPIVGDCRAALSLMLEGGSARVMRLRAGNQARAAWLRAIRDAGAREYDPDQAASEAAPLHPALVAAELRRALPREAAVAVDRGTHRDFFAHYFQAYGPRTFFTASHPGAVGWAVPAAIGIKAALPGIPVACVTGDGSMLVHGMEVATAVRHGLPVVFVVLGNAALGEAWLRAAQEGPGPLSLTELPGRDFAAFGRAMGARGITVARPEALAPALAEALSGEGPCVVDVRCDRRFPPPAIPRLGDEERREE